MIIREGRVRPSFGKRDQIYTLDPFGREDYWLPGVQVEVVEEIFPLWYCSLIIIHFFPVESNEVATRNLRTIRSDFRAPKWLIGGSEARGLSSILAFSGADKRRVRDTADQYQSPSLVNQQNFGGSAPRSVHVAPDLIPTGGAHLSQRGKGLLCRS